MKYEHGKEKVGQNAGNEWTRSHCDLLTSFACVTDRQGGAWRSATSHVKKRRMWTSFICEFMNIYEYCLLSSVFMAYILLATFQFPLSFCRVVVKRKKSLITRLVGGVPFLSFSCVHSPFICMFNCVFIFLIFLTYFAVLCQHRSQHHHHYHHLLIFVPSEFTPMDLCGI